VYGDQAYRGQKKVIRARTPNAEDFTNQRYRHRSVVDEVERGKNRTKSGVRAKVEHPFGVVMSMPVEISPEVPVENSPLRRVVRLC
jgi:IS5 family transposase